MKPAFLMLWLVSVSGGCSKPLPEASPAVAAPPPPTTGTGRVVVGQAPPAVNGMSAIVILDPEPAREFSPQAERPVMDQINQMFTPDVLFVRTGQPVEFHNSDDELHNIDVKENTTKEQAFNAAIPMGGVYVFTFTQPGLYDVRCDIHSTMSALIVASPSPYAKLADADGHFEFDDVEAGPYTVRAYAGAASLAQPIDVRGPRTDVSIKN